MSVGPNTAVVLLSGGLDSATCLALACRDGFECHALTFDYGQRHKIEVQCAARVAASVGAASHTVYTLDVTPFAGSSLTTGGQVPKDGGEPGASGVPSTYVPARNLVFLSIAAAYAETLGGSDIYIGVNAVDYSGYPDCRPAFVRAFAQAATLATRRGTEGNQPLNIHAPLLELSKADIVRSAAACDVDLALTTSCYDPGIDDDGPIACGRCEACVLRRRGFCEAAIEDPTRYAESMSR